MKKYRVRLSRQSIADCSVEVEAMDRKEAEIAAVRQGEGGADWFIVDDGDIEVDGITELSDLDDNERRF